METVDDGFDGAEGGFVEDEVSGEDVHCFGIWITCIMIRNVIVSKGRGRDTDGRGRSSLVV